MQDISIQFFMSAVVCDSQKLPYGSYTTTVTLAAVGKDTNVFRCPTYTHKLVVEIVHQYTEQVKGKPESSSMNNCQIECMKNSGLAPPVLLVICETNSNHIC